MNLEQWKCELLIYTYCLRCKITDKLLGAHSTCVWLQHVDLISVCLKIKFCETSYFFNFGPRSYFSFDKNFNLCQVYIKELMSLS